MLIVYIPRVGVKSGRFVVGQGRTAYVERAGLFILDCSRYGFQRDVSIELK